MDKAEARKLGKRVRVGLEPGEKAALDARIVARAQRELEWARYRRVHLFLPIKRLGEIDTWPLVAWLWQEWPKLQVYVPRTAGGIAQVRITPETRFEVNAGGIPEPVVGEGVNGRGEVLGEGEEVDLVLTPLLAFDDRGGRVGYGGGFYDRFLATQPGALRVGLAYEAVRVAAPKELALEPFDVRLHGVITERRVRRFAKIGLGMGGAR